MNPGLRAAEKTSLLVSYTASYAQLAHILAHFLALKKRGVACRPYQSDPLPPKKLSVARAPRNRQQKKFESPTKGDHIIGVKQRFPVAWAAPKRSWLTEPAPTASS